MGKISLLSITIFSDPSSSEDEDENHHNHICNFAKSSIDSGLVQTIKGRLKSRVRAIDNLTGIKCESVWYN